MVWSSLHYCDNETHGISSEPKNCRSEHKLSAECKNCSSGRFQRRGSDILICIKIHVKTNRRAGNKLTRLIRRQVEVTTRGRM